MVPLGEGSGPLPKTISIGAPSGAVGASLCASGYLVERFEIAVRELLPSVRAQHPAHNAGQGYLPFTDLARPGARPAILRLPSLGAGTARRGYLSKVALLTLDAFAGCSARELSSRLLLKYYLW